MGGTGLGNPGRSQRGTSCPVPGCPEECLHTLGRDCGRVLSRPRAGLDAAESRTWAGPVSRETRSSQAPVPCPVESSQPRCAAGGFGAVAASSPSLGETPRQGRCRDPCGEAASPGESMWRVSKLLRGDLGTRAWVPGLLGGAERFGTPRA